MDNYLDNVRRLLRAGWQTNGDRWIKDGFSLSLSEAVSHQDALDWENRYHREEEGLKKHQVLFCVAKTGVVIHVWARDEYHARAIVKNAHPRAVVKEVLCCD